MTTDPQTQTDAASAGAAVAASASEPAATNSQALKVAVSRGEAILLLILVLLGMGVWTVADHLVTSYAKVFEPREEQFQLEHHLPRLQASLALTQDELKGTQEQLIKSGLELTAQEAALAVSAAFPPAAAEKAGETSAAPAPAGQPKAAAAEKPVAAEAKPAAPPAAEARVEALRKWAAAKQLADSFTARFEMLQNRVTDLSGRIESARRSVAGEFYRSQWNFRTAKALVTLVLAALALLLLLRLVSGLRRARRLHGRVPGLSADGSLMWWTVAGLVLVLFGYQAFETAGAALAGVAVLLIFLARVPWPAPAAARKLDAKAGAKAGAAGGV